MRGPSTVAEFDAAIDVAVAALCELRRGRMAAKNREREQDARRAAARADFERGVHRSEICERHGLTAGQLAGWINRGKWDNSKQRRGRRPIFTGDRLANLRRAYEDPSRPISMICATFKISHEGLRVYVVRHGWKRRASPLRGLSVLQRATYNKLRPHVGRAAALAEAQREVVA